MSSLDDVEELVAFLGSPRADVRAAAVQHVLAVSGTDAGVVMLLSAGEGAKSTLELLVRMLGDAPAAAADAASALTNMSCNERARDALVQSERAWKPLLEAVSELQRLAPDKAVPARAVACLKLLNNLTTTLAGSQRFITGRLGEQHAGLELRLVVAAFLAGGRRHVELAPAALVMTNVSRLDAGRDVLVAKRGAELCRLLALLALPETPVETRLALAETARNCCLIDETAHRKLLRGDVVPRLLLPLLGPTGVREQEDYNELPPLLKAALMEQAREGGAPVRREPDARVRGAVVDTLVLLCSSRRGRDRLRDCKAYAVVKEYHAEESDEELIERLFSLVDLLLGEEEAVQVIEEEDEDSGVEDASKAQAPPAAPARGSGKPDMSSLVFQVD
jgi:hypothetical protein